MTSTPFLEIVSTSSRVSTGEGISGATDVDAGEGEEEGESRRHASKKSVGTSKIERCRFSCEVELVVGRRGAVAIVTTACLLDYFCTRIRDFVDL